MAEEEEKTQTQKDTEKAASRTQSRSEHTQTRSEHTQIRSEHTQTRSEHTVLSGSHSENQGGDSGAATGASAEAIPASPLSSNQSALSSGLNSKTVQDSFYQYTRPFVKTWDTVSESVYDLPEQPLQYDPDPTVVPRGTRFPLEIFADDDEDGNLQIKVAESKVLDYTASGNSPNEVDVSELAGSAGAGTFYISLKITIASSNGHNVTSAVLESGSSQPQSGENDYQVPVGQYTINSVGNGLEVGEIKQFTTGAIYYPFFPPWSGWTTGSKYLEIGLANNLTEKADFPSKVEGLIVNAIQVFQLVVGSEGEEIVNIDTTDLSGDNPLAVKQVLEEDNTFDVDNGGYIIATNNFKKGVLWASYTGSATSAGNVDVGGANVTGKVNNFTFNTESLSGTWEFKTAASGGSNNGVKMTMFGDEWTQVDIGSSSQGSSISLGNIEGGDSFSTGSGGMIVSSDLSSDSGSGSYGHKGLDVGNGDQRVTISADQLSEVSEAHAFFRSVKVCKDGVKSTAMILMTDPVAD